MDIELSAAPDAIQALVHDLEQEGFELVNQRGDGSVNRLAELRQGSCGVRISADRGQWWLELGGVSLGDWHDPDVWEACLDDTPVRREPSSIDYLADFARRRWGEVAAQLTSDTLADCLNRKRSTRVRERLGLPPQVENEVS